MSEFLSTRINVECPDCQTTFIVSPRDIQHELLVNCPHGHQVQLRDRIARVEQSDPAAPARRPRPPHQHQPVRPVKEANSE